MRYIDDVIPDIQSDCDKIAKAFNKAAAKFIYEVLEADDANGKTYYDAAF